MMTSDKRFIFYLPSPYLFISRFEIMRDRDKRYFIKLIYFYEHTSIGRAGARQASQGGRSNQVRHCFARHG